MNGVPFVVPEDQKEFSEAVLTKVQKWLENPDAREPCILEKCNAFQRRIVYRHDSLRNHLFLVKFKKTWIQILVTRLSVSLVFLRDA